MTEAMIYKRLKPNLHARLSDNQLVVLHILTGIMLFYFLIHPLTMVIYWFEFSGMEYSVNLFLNAVKERILESFSLHMLKMSTVFIVLGGLIGLGSGLYYKMILLRDKALMKHENRLKRDIDSIIRGGENQKVEFKSSLRYDYNIQEINKSLEQVITKSIAGFLNAEGGKLILGLADDGGILGLENDYQSLRRKNRDGFEQKIYQLVSSGIGAEFCSLVQLFFFNVDNKEVCVIEIEPSLNPAYVNSGDSTTFYLRTGNATRPLNIQEAVNYIELYRKNSKSPIR